MNSRLIQLIAFINGFVLISFELIYPRMTAIWFGNVTSIWVINIVSTILSIGIGYLLSSILLAKNTSNPFKVLNVIFMGTAVYLLLLIHIYDDILDMLIELPLHTGAIIFALMMIFPLVGMLSIASPILVHLLSDTLKKEAVSIVFFISTFGGVLGILALAFYFLPYRGIYVTGMLMNGLLLVNVILVQWGKKSVNAGV